MNDQAPNAIANLLALPQRLFGNLHAEMALQALEGLIERSGPG